jgi:hypothetical protein
MSHFAKIEDGVVTEVIVAEQDFVDTLDGTWVQTSYNTRHGVHYGQDGNPDGGVALRLNYAGIGFTYDADADAFYYPKPFDSWVLDETKGEYFPPIDSPELTEEQMADGYRYDWDDDAYKADNTQGWVLTNSNP